MSALTTLFNSLANKIRSKTGGSDTYTPPEMVDAIDDVYDAGVASATTPITPSNASPASMTSGTGYKPTANGYAISNYNNVTPSDSSPVALTSGDIDKIGGNGYAIENYFDLTPSSTIARVSVGKILKINDKMAYIVDYLPPQDLQEITPSNSSPVRLTAINSYLPLNDGYAIASYSSITPSNSAPVSLSANSPVIPASSGYAIESYQSKTPSDSNPPSISSGAIIKASASGWFTKSPLPTFGGTPDKTYAKNTAGTSGTTDISVDQKPRYIVIAIWARSSTYTGFCGIVDVANNRAYRMGYVSSGAVNGDWTSGYTGYFPTISSTKVTYNEAGYGGNHRVQIQIFY